MTAAILILATASLVGLGFWVYGIHARQVTAAEARGYLRGYNRRTSEGVAAGFDAGWHPGMTRGAR